MTNDTDNAEPTGPKTYKISEGRLAGLQDKIAKLSARATKLTAQGLLADQTTIGLTIVGEVHEPVVRYDHETGKHVETGAVHVFKLVQVTGVAPKLAGWTFGAKIEHVEVEGARMNLIKSAPGVETSFAAYRDAAPDCAHCNVKRWRRDTYVMLNDDGRQLQVGSTCLTDFLGGVSPDGAARMMEIWSLVTAAVADEESEGGGGGRRETWRAGLLPFLSLVCSLARLDGWMSASEARRRDDGTQATGRIAWQLTFPTSFQAKDAAKAIAAITDEDRAFAAAAVEAAREIENPDNDYLHNLKVIATVPLIDGRMAGLAASLYAWHRRNLDQEIARRASLNEYRGAVGDKLVDVPVTLVKVTHFDSKFGTTHMHSFRDAEGRTIIWRTGSASLELGVYYMSATVKAHKEWKEWKQTEVTRAVCNTEAEHQAKLAILAEKAAAKAAKKRAPRKPKALKAKAESTCAACDGQHGPNDCPDRMDSPLPVSHSCQYGCHRCEAR